MQNMPIGPCPVDRLWQHPKQHHQTSQGVQDGARCSQISLRRMNQGVKGAL